MHLDDKRIGGQLNPDTLISSILQPACVPMHACQCLKPSMSETQAMHNCKGLNRVLAQHVNRQAIHSCHGLNRVLRALALTGFGERYRYQSVRRPS